MLLLYYCDIPCIRFVDTLCVYTEDMDEVVASGHSAVCPRLLHGGEDLQPGAPAVTRLEGGVRYTAPPRRVTKGKTFHIAKQATI